MTAKEKAVELYNKFNEQIPIDAEFSDTVENANRKIWYDHVATKRCALIAVDEIIKALEDYGRSTMELQNMEREFAWWDKVKTEIEKL
jgi:hypothetical protein